MKGEVFDIEMVRNGFYIHKQIERRDARLFMRLKKRKIKRFHEA